LPAENPSVEPAFAVKSIDEWSSPAFIKRARTSYGSLFESDYDPFAEEDGTVPGKGRKKTRLSSSWRYTSRSPTPEVEDQEMEGIEEPSLSKPVTVMIDEACQTIGLEEGSAAEALADFSRQSTNVGSSSYAALNGSLPLPMQGLGNEAVELEVMLPRTTNIVHQEPTNSSAPEREKLPSSPQLHPIPSDSPPLVSTLVPSRIGQWSETTRLIPSQSKDISTHSPILSQNGSEIAVEEDIYGASPPHQHQEQIETEFSDQQNSELPMNRPESSNFMDSTIPEDQYGQWESINAQIGHPHVPYLEVGQEDHPMPSHQIYPEEVKSPDYQNNMPQHHNHEQKFSQYPELEDELPAQENSAWAYSQSEVPYPELPHAGLAGAVSHPDIRPQSVVMSRSQSARSEAIDLTEDSDEEQPHSAQQSLQGDEDADVSIEAGQEEVLDPNNDYQRDENGTDHLQRHSTSDVDNVEQMSEAGDSYDEGGSEDEYPDDRVLQQDVEESELMVRNYDTDEEDSQRSDDHAEGEEEEESYDEEEFDEEDEILVTRVPEVIDLLSSDDEDEPSPPKRSVDSARPMSPSVHSSVENDEVDEDEEMIEARASSEDSEPENDDLDSGSEEERRISGDEKDEQDSIMHTTGRESPDTTIQPRIMSEGDDQVIADIEQENESVGEEGPAAAKQSAYSQQQNPSPVQSSLFARVFSLDGANDDPEESDSNHPILSRKHSTPPASITQTAPAVENGNAQLPTPDDTQITENMISPNESFESLQNQIQTEVSRGASKTDGLISATCEQLLIQVETYTRIKVVEETFEINQDAVDTQMGGVEGNIGTSDNVVSQTQVENTLESSEEVLDSTMEHVDVELEHEITETSISQIGVEVVDETLDPSEDVVDISMEDVEINLDASENAASQTRADLLKKELDPSEALQDKEEEEIDLLAQISQKLDEEQPLHEDPDGDTERILQLPAVPDAPLQDMSIIETEEATVEEAGERLMRRSLPLPAPDAPFEASTMSVEFKTPPPPEREDLLEQIQRAGENQTPRSARAAQDENDEFNLRESSIDLVSVPQEALVDSPRRSARRAKLNPQAVNQKENTKLVTPVKSHTMKDVASGGKEVASPLVFLDARATPKGHDASIELALDSADSPTKPTHDLRKPPVADKKLILSRALRTDQDLSQYTSLKVLRYHLNQKLDVLAIATTSTPEPRRAKGGPRHYQITFNVTDPSIAPSVVTEIQVYRPYQEALPIVKAGDGILLRNFLVVSVKGRGFGLKSTQDEGSSWAVFKDGEEPEIRGPPVEYGESEKKHVTGLKSWYEDLDATAMAKINRANGDKGTGTGATPSKALK
jgi:hypothetical protein